MKTMILNDYGPDAAFTPAETERPSVKPGHVLVRVKATSVNTVDTMIRDMGRDLPLSPDLPAILGMDFAGIVEEVGEGVAGFAVGDEVYGCAGGLADLQGALAEYMLADARLIAPKPTSLSMREAAALPLVGITAWEGLHRAGVGRGQKVLVQGGAGGVGHLAVQIARHLGADVWSTGTGEAKLAAIEKFGATPIDYQTETVEAYVAAHTGGAGFDVVFDTVGGENMTNSFAAAALNAQGRLDRRAAGPRPLARAFQGLVAACRLHAAADASRCCSRGAWRDPGRPRQARGCGGREAALGRAALRLGRGRRRLCPTEER